LEEKNKDNQKDLPGFVELVYFVVKPEYARKVSKII
jgi:hypothetical protein